MMMTPLTFQHFETIDSTSEELKRQAEQGAPDGRVISADFQTAGHGKPGTHWVSPAGKNLLFSLLIRPKLQSSQAPMLTQLAARSVAQVLNQYHLDTVFKRPNDILVDGKKICGVLVESTAQADGKVHYVIIGIGLNVNADHHQLIDSACSMKDCLKRDLDLNLLKDQILKQLTTDLEAFYAALI